MIAKRLTAAAAGLLLLPLGLWLAGCTSDSDDKPGSGAAGGDGEVGYQGGGPGGGDVQVPPTNGPGDPADGHSPPDGDAPAAPDGDAPPAPDGDGDGDGGGIVITPGGGDGDGEGGPECMDDRDCAYNPKFGGDYYCDPDLKVCKRRKSICEPCEGDLECGFSEDLCLPSKVCGIWCDPDYTCADQGWEGFLCKTFPDYEYQQCDFDPTQTTGEEGSLCCEDKHCNKPLVCHDQTHRCYQGCSGPSACPPGQVCIEDETSGRNGHCKEGCLVKEDCKGGEVCWENACVEGDCTDKSHCPLEYKCEVETFSCVSGCDNDGDCFAVNECVDGQCVERIGCEGTYQCSLAEMCSVELPDGDREDRGCCFNPTEEVTGEGEFACTNPYGVKAFCRDCNEPAESAPECDGDPCLEVVIEEEDGSETRLGPWCFVNWDCTFRQEGELEEGTVECPRGYTCVKITGDIEMKTCFADCRREEFKPK